MDRPTVRLIHNLARSGGTLIGRCLGSMDGIFLLSEIHPLGLERFHPAVQAQSWFNLLTDDDVAYFQSPGAKPFAEAIVRIERRARERGGVLVIRDWAHLDFMGKPFLDRPTGHLAMAAALQGTMELRRVALARHPADQIESLLRTWAGETMPPFDEFLAMNRKYAEAVDGLELVRFEDFTADPDRELRRLCAALDVAFDEAYRDRWRGYRTITGDKTGSRGGFDAIRPLERKPPPPAIHDVMMRSEDYLKACALLGYEP